MVVMVDILVATILVTLRRPGLESSQEEMDYCLEFYLYSRQHSLSGMRVVVHVLFMSTVWLNSEAYKVAWVGSSFSANSRSTRIGHGSGGMGALA